MDDKTLRERKKKIIAMLILQLHLLNSLTMIVLVTCITLLLEQLKKNKRRKLRHNRQLAMDSSVGEIEAEYEADSQVPQIETTSQANMGSSTTQVKKKRKRADKGLNALDKVAETIGMIKSFNKQLSINVREFVSCFEHENERAKRVKNLHALLKDIDGLTVKQRIRVAIIILKDNNLIDSIFTLTPEDRFEFVSAFLNQSS